MKLEATSAGLEAELRLAGIGRFFGAAFLAVWLAGWAVGEAFALGILGVGAWSLLTGQPLAGRETFRPELALPVGLFLLFWLALWTLGGVMAARELLRLLFGRDRIRAGHDSLEIERSYGLFRSREKLRREELRRFYCRTVNAALCVETARGMTELTMLGTAVERTELEQALNTEFHLAAQPAPEGALPDGWCETSSLEHDAVLVKDPPIQRKQAITAWIVGSLLAFLALYLISASLRRPELWGLALIVAASVALVTWGAVWLSCGRNEWRLEKGRLVLQRRFGVNRTMRFEAVGLELNEDSSGDGDTSYLLSAVAADAPLQSRFHSAGKHRRVIHSQTADPIEPRKFGQWLSQRCQLPFADLTTPEARAKDLEALMQQLANSGRFGRAASSIVKRLAPSPPPPGT